MTDPADKLRETLQEFLAAAPGAEWRQKARTVAAACLQRLDVVSREEFDAHCKMLAQATQKIAELEKQLDAQLKTAPKTRRKK